MWKSSVFCVGTLVSVLSACTGDVDSRVGHSMSDSNNDVPTLRPDLPDATQVRFTLRIDLEAGDPAEIFVATAEGDKRPETKETSLAEVQGWLVTAEDSGLYNPALFIDYDWINTQREFNDAARTISDINPQAVWWQYQQGRRLRFVPKTDPQADKLDYEFVDTFGPLVHRPARLFLRDHYTLSNFVGDYGTGRIVNTFSLLPGETTELRVMTYRDQSLRSESTTSILDSTSEESTEQFLEALSDTNTSDDRSSESRTQADFNASGSYSAFTTSAKANTNADIQSSAESRRDFHSKVAASVAQTASQASASRDVYVDTNVESTVAEGREDVSIRTISNINTGHTLNFISYQMNQQYHSLLHLTRVEVGYDDGFGNVYTVPLYQLDALLSTFVTETQRDVVRSFVVAELEALVDYRGDTHPEFLSKTASEEAADLSPSIYRINYDFTSEFAVEGKDRTISVPGIIMDVQPVVMRTDGIYVESLVGKSPAWDEYTRQLKMRELRR